MTKKPKTSIEKLYQTAAGQAGCFTTAQAIKAGFDDNTHPYHVKAGNWIREWRGIYRLSRYPVADTGHYVLWSLWSRNRANEPQGIYSHETALSLYDLSDAMPGRIHMTVPSTFRRHSKIPGVLRLHFGLIQPDEIEEREGYRVTKPMRTIVDLTLDKSVSLDILRQALSEGKKRGLISRKVVDSYREKPHAYDTIEPVLRGVF